MTLYIIEDHNEGRMKMQDEMIVELFWQRDETALAETETKYSGYLNKIAYGILADIEDAKEAVNETLLKAWNSIPPQRPGILKTYLGRITRQLSIDTYRRLHREKRIASEMTVSLEELSDTVGGGDVAGELDYKALGEAIDRYLKTLGADARAAFVQRYYFNDTLREIAARQGSREGRIKSMLYRTRQGLREYLEKEGFEV